MFRTSVFLMGVMLGEFVFSFLRDRTLAWAYGADESSDTFFRLLFMPLFFIAVFDNLFQSAVIPQVSALGRKLPRDRVLHLMQGVSTVLLAILAVVTLGAALFHGPLLRLLEPSWTGEAAAEARNVGRWLLPTFVLLGLAHFGRHVLNSFGHHYLAALVMLPRQIVLIVTVLFLWRTWGVEAAAFGFTVGILAQYIPVVIGLRKLHFRPVEVLAHDWPEVRRFLSFLVLPGIGIFAFNLFYPIEAKIAGSLEAGAITTVYFARRVCALLGGLFWSSLGVVTYTQVSQLWHGGERERAVEGLARALRYATFLALPLVGFGLAGRHALLQLAVGAGKFAESPEALPLTADQLLFLLPATVAAIYASLVMGPFLMAGRTGTHCLINCSYPVTIVAFDVLFVYAFGERRLGLAIGYSLSVILTLPVCYLVFRRQIAPLPMRKLLTHFGTVALSVLPGAAAVGYLSGRLRPDGFVASAVVLGALAGLFGLVYFGIAHLLRVKEAKDVLRALTRRGTAGP